MKLSFSLILILAFTSYNSYSQTNPNGYLLRATLGSASPKKSKTQNFDVIQSINQASVIGSTFNNKIILRQGYIQPDVNGDFTNIPSNILLNAKVYPNPFINSFKIDFSEKITTPITVSIYDVTGKIIYSKIFNSPSQTIDIEISAPIAVYTIQTSANNKVFASRIIKK